MTLYMIEKEHAWASWEALYIFEDRENAVKKFNEIKPDHAWRFFISLSRVTIVDGKVADREYYDDCTDKFERNPFNNKAHEMMEEVREMFTFCNDRATQMLSLGMELQAENDKLKRVRK